MQRSDNNYYSSYVCDIVCINKLLYLYKYIYMRMLNILLQSCNTEFCLLLARMDLMAPADEDAPDLLLL